MKKGLILGIVLVFVIFLSGCEAPRLSGGWHDNGCGDVECGQYFCSDEQMCQWRYSNIVPKFKISNQEILKSKSLKIEEEEAMSHSNVNYRCVNHTDSGYENFVCHGLGVYNLLEDGSLSFIETCGSYCSEGQCVDPCSDGIDNDGDGITDDCSREPGDFVCNGNPNGNCEVSETETCGYDCPFCYNFVEGHEWDKSSSFNGQLDAGEFCEFPSGSISPGFRFMSQGPFEDPIEINIDNSGVISSFTLLSIIKIPAFI